MIVPKAWRKWLALVLLGLATMWLAWPAFTPVHFEGISAASELLARWGPQRVAAGGAGLFPLVAEFVYASRPLTIAALHGLATLGIDPADGFGLLVVPAFALFLASSIAFARAFGGQPLRALLLALLALPGVTTLGYTLNDNVLSASLAMAGLALVAWRNTPMAYAAAGLLIGLGFGFRPDVVLLAPGLALVGWLRNDTLAALAVRGAAGGAGVVAALVAIWVATGLTPVDMLAVVRLFTREVAEAHDLVVQLDNADIPAGSLAPASAGGGGPIVAALTNFVCFFGPAGLVLCAVGAIAGLLDEVRAARVQRTLSTVKRLLLLYAYPAALLLYAFRFAIVLRYFYPFATPFLIFHGAHGLLLLWRVARVRGPATRTALGALAVAVVLMPPLISREVDGPSGFTGVAWTPRDWIDWQRSIRAGQDRVQAFAQAARPGTTSAVVSTDYSDQYFTLLAFARAGYIPESGQCGGALAMLRAPDGAAARIVATDNPYNLARMATRLTRAGQVVAAQDCGVGASGRFALVFFPHSGKLVPAPLFGVTKAEQALLARDAIRLHGSRMQIASYGIVPLDAVRWRRIVGAARRDLRGVSGQKVVARMDSTLAARLPSGHMRF